MEGSEAGNPQWTPMHFDLGLLYTLPPARSQVLLEACSEQGSKWSSSACLAPARLLPSSCPSLLLSWYVCLPVVPMSGSHSAVLETRKPHLPV